MGNYSECKHQYTNKVSRMLGKNITHEKDHREVHQLPKVINSITRWVSLSDFFLLVLHKAFK